MANAGGQGTLTTVCWLEKRDRFNPLHDRFADCFPSQSKKSASAPPKFRWCARPPFLPSGWTIKTSIKANVSGGPLVIIVEQPGQPGGDCENVTGRAQMETIYIIWTTRRRFR
jgi:hypothetical protein